MPEFYVIYLPENFFPGPLLPVSSAYESHHWNLHHFQWRFVYDVTVKDYALVTQGPL